MSIVPLEKVTLAGLTADKERLLSDLHTLGTLELISLRGETIGAAHAEPCSRAQEALKFLLSCPSRRYQAPDESRFDGSAVETRALKLQQEIHALELEKDDLLQRLELARPWGDFQFPALGELGEFRLWFYLVPHKNLPQVEATDLVWKIVRRDQRFCYVVVVASTEPQSMPVPRTPMGSRSPSENARRLEEVELAIEDAQAERAHLTRWCMLFAKNLARLEDEDFRTTAAQRTYDCEPLFALQAWVPQDTVAELREYATRNGFVFECRPPLPQEDPPTLMLNAPRVRAGEDLVNFYMTPGYWTWDPSPVVLISFALFFAMILADAGYAAILAMVLLASWRHLGKSDSGQRFRPMLALIVEESLVYGILVGSYYGLAPPRGSFLARLHLFDMNNSQLMMGISVLVGGMHVILANLMDAHRRTNWIDRLASLGWASAVAGGLILAAGAVLPQLAFLQVLGALAVVAGLLLVLGFTAPHEKPVQRGIQGLLGLTKVSAAFGDILSYLRLFALGLASASLAVAFNDMAAGIRGSLPRVGLLLALLVLLFGHALNLLLGVSSGVIHGLRLNVIEFFNWGLKDEGRRFTPFRRKEGS